jgi:hypothetical protein
MSNRLNDEPPAIIIIMQRLPAAASGRWRVDRAV